MRAISCLAEYRLASEGLCTHRRGGGLGSTASADDLERRTKSLVHARDQIPERSVQGKRLLNWALDSNVQLITQLTVERYGAVCTVLNPLKPELNSICYLLALLGAPHFLHVGRIRVKLLTFRLLMSYIYGAPILDVSRSHTTTQHSR